MPEKLGINVVFKGETTEFEKAVKSVNNEIRVTKTEISSLNRQLKLDPSNVELLAKKLDTVSKKSEELANKVKLYEDALKQMPSDMVGTDEWVKLNAELNKAQAELAEVNAELQRTPTAGVQSLNKNLEQIETKLNKIGDTLENVGKKFMVLTGAITGLATAGVAYNAELERQTTLFTTLTGSAEKAEAVLNAIKEDAKTAPFDTNSLISANQYLISTGLEAEKAREVILNLGDAISATGGGNSELQRMAQNLQQIQNVGKASSMDMKQFAMAGIDIWGILADTTGKTVEQLQDMDITFDMIADALNNASREGGKYYGAMSAQSDTLNGKITMLKATFQELLGSLTETLMPIIKQVIDVMQEWINKIQKLNDDQKETIVRILAIVAGIGPLLTIIGKLIGSSGIGGLIKAVRKFITSEKFTLWVSKIIEMGGGLQGFFTTVVSSLKALITPMNAVIAVLVLLYAKSETFRTSVNNLIKVIANTLSPLFVSLKGLITTLIDVFKTIASTIGTILKPVIDALINILGSLLGKVADVVSKLVSGLKPAIDLIVAVVQLVTAEFKLWITYIKNDTANALNAIKGVINGLKDAFNSFKAKVSELFNVFKNTTWGNVFIGILEKIGQWIGTLRQWFGWLIGDINDSINKTNQLIAVQDNATRYNNTRSAPRSVMYGSGGLGITANIHVTNNGTPIDQTEIRRWVDMIATEVDQQLGRAF